MVQPVRHNFVGTYGSPSSLIVTPSASATFDFKSLQICNPNSAIDAQQTVFNGVRADGSSVTASFTTPAHNTSPQTFAPSGFEGLRSLTVGLGFVAFDNFVFVA
jgi:hypothetical protein